METEKIKIEYRSINEIKPYKFNPRKNDKAVDIVARSIKEYGFLVPIVIDQDNIIVCGHTRIKAAAKIGLTEVPTILASNLTEEQIKGFRIMDNKANEYANWNNEFLIEELKELKDLNFNMDCTGFSEIEVSKFLSGNEETDETIPLTPKYEVKLGDIFQLGTHRVMCGDSTNKEQVSKLLGGGSMVLMVTDPPYGVDYHPEWRDKADKGGILGNRYPTRAIGNVENDKRIDWSEAYNLFNGDVAYVWHAGKYACEVKESLTNSGFEIISQIIWAKPHFALSRGDYHWKHEPCWYAVRKGKQHNWQGSRNECTIWEIAGMNAMGASHDPSDERTGHGTQKPIECMKKPIMNNSKVGDNIYDPFGGSGSTLIACEQVKRNCFMMELDPIYCSFILERWEKLTSKKAEKLN
jgi:DNA modification methylase